MPSVRHCQLAAALSSLLQQEIIDIVPLTPHRQFTCCSTATPPHELVLIVDCNLWFRHGQNAACQSRRPSLRVCASLGNQIPSSVNWLSCLLACLLLHLPGHAHLRYVLRSTSSRMNPHSSQQNFLLVLY
ncbi:Hypothetical predicted protein [Pelobates cultripes]|uniref:Uncharacterized protein n=1 Tax=Pelobates cultripes TaxID=61616 RepID=A0AAD1W424_PELCU|nr:Hypothetical predicted protein [Pelobates cultripes]